MEDELLALEAIYCRDGEFCILAKGNPTIIQIKVTCEDCQAQLVKEKLISLTLTLSPAYPETRPDISLQASWLTREESEKLKDGLQEYCASLIGFPMIMEMIVWLQKHFNKYLKQESVTHIDSPSAKTAEHSKRRNDQYGTVLLHLDHMRAKAKYTKTILKWTEELGLRGRLVFQDRMILIILQGELHQIKEYISRQRSVNVDVDSKGRSCKERMLSVLAEIPCDHQKIRFSDFASVEYNSLKDVEELFRYNDLSTLFADYIKPLVKR